jgi:hypothetical protein
MSQTWPMPNGNAPAVHMWAASTGSHRLSARAAKALDDQWTDEFDGNVLNVRPDSIDFRDRYYEPSLIEVKAYKFPEPLEARKLAVRDQGLEGSCTGQALAAVIDIQNIERFDLGADVPRRVSARMLYESARAFDEFPDDGLAGSSLRGALKGFFHRGVCDAALAPYFDGDVAWRLTADLFKEARKISLGAYLRLRHELNAYHTAIHDAGAIYCSAMIHDGWRRDEVRRKGGRIELPPARPGVERQVPLAGAHAFAIVGYDSKGFIVLNSWGEEWGQFDAAKAYLADLAKRNIAFETLRSVPAATGPLPGMAHWSYEDWRLHVLDAWVLRLGAPAGLPSDYAGGYLSGRGGAGGANSAEGAESSRSESPTTRDQEIRGHFIHVDDGVLSRMPPYDNSRLTFEETRDYLIENEKVDERNEKTDKARRYDHILFYAHGGLNNLEVATARAATMTRVFKRLRIYPIFYIWRTGFGETLEDVLHSFAAKIFTRTQGISGLTDALIERLARTAGGRAIWRDMKLDAERCFNPVVTTGAEPTWNGPGGAWMATKTLLEVASKRKKHPVKVHFIGHSAGAILLGEFFGKAAASEPGLMKSVSSVELFAPACTMPFFERNLLPVAARKTVRMTISNLVDRAEAQRDPAMRPYNKSLLYLVSNAFEDVPRMPLAGMELFWDGMPDAVRKAVTLEKAGQPSANLPNVATHGGFDNDAAAMNRAVTRMLGRTVTEKNGGFTAADLERQPF